MIKFVFRDIKKKLEVIFIFLTFEHLTLERLSVSYNYSFELLTGPVKKIKLGLPSDRR